MKRSILRIGALLGALVLTAGMAEDAVDLLAVDHRLYELGYRDGACTGVMDEVMVNALRNFQLVNGLGITGEPDAGTVLVLNSDSAVSQGDYLARIAQESAEAAQLQTGMAGDAVARLQRALAKLGYFEGRTDGAFGEATAEAVRRFQFANGLPATGVADGAVFQRLYAEDPVDWEGFLLGCVASAGDNGPAVRMLQYWLREKGYFDGECTGRYGEGTQRAVRQFQSGAGLDASGDADAETCRALYGDVGALLADATALRLGAQNAGEMAPRLTALGYAAHAEFDMQTELALMQFQWANGLEPTGVADAATMERLGSVEAVGRSSFVGAGAERALEEDFGAKLVRESARLLGRKSGFDEEFGMIQYAYMKCGVAIAGRGEFALVGEALRDAQPGDVMVLELDGGERCGVTASDGALIYRGSDGRILMGYPHSMGAKSVRLYRPAEP